jgi:hypothetical protein
MAAARWVLLHLPSSTPSKELSMRTSKTPQLEKARKQVGHVVDQFDLDKRALDVADRTGVVKRKRKLGIPLGRRRPDWGRIAAYGVAAMAGAMGSKAFRRNGDASSSDLDAGAERASDEGAPESESNTA